ncbi:MAG: hypothetical protein AAFY48_08795 [Bacteroidota bacterium]
MDSLLDSCKAACKGNSRLTKDNFLCSGNYVDQQNIILQYGYDPCLDDAITPESTLGIEDQWAKMQPVLIILGLILIGALVILYIKNNK